MKYPQPVIVQIPGYEKVIHFNVDPLKLNGYIAIHSTKLGPALGGARIWNYASEQEALTDALRLAEGMTYKAAGAGLKLGGGKAVLIGDADKVKSKEYFAAFGSYVEWLKGRYITAEDVNTNTADMKQIAVSTKHVVGLEGKSGNPSPWTALGVFEGIKASIDYAFHTQDLSRFTFAVQGTGATGTYLIRHLVAAKAKKIYIAEKNPDHLNKITKEFPLLTVVPIDQLLGLDVDVIAPCALGGILNDQTIPTLKAKIIAGSANNILLDPAKHGAMIQHKQILLAPDFIINAGGLINVSFELSTYDHALVQKQVEAIGPRIKAIYALAKEKQIDTSKAARLYTEKVLGR